MNFITRYTARTDSDRDRAMKTDVERIHSLYYKLASRLTRKAMDSKSPKERELYLEQAQACLREVESML